jgi:hypothetical protein
MKGEKKHGPGNGKLIDKWPFVFDALTDDPNWTPKEDDDEDVKPRQLAREGRVTIEVYMTKNFRECLEPPHPPEDVKFLLRCESKECGIETIRMVGTDLEVLRKAMFARLSNKFEIRFENYYLVQVNDVRQYGGALGAGVEFNYKDVEKGICWDGSLVMRKWEGMGERWKISPWPGEFKDSGGNVLALIPRTEEHTASLEEFARRVQEMRKAMSDLLRPHNIAETLAALKSMPGIPMLQDTAS